MATTSPGFRPAAMNPRARRFDDFSIFRVGEAAAAGAVDDGGLVREALAAIENQVVHEAVVRIGVELGAEHGRR